MLKSILMKTPRLLLSNFLRFIVMSITLLIALTIGIFYSGILTGLSAAIFLIGASVNVSLGSIITIIISLLGIFIPYGLFMYPYFRCAYVTHFIILEGASSIYAFNRSIKITGNGYFKVVFSYIFISILFLSIDLVIIAIPAIFMSYFGFENVRSIVEQLSIIVSIICYPMSVALSTVLYISQIRKNDGIDLLMRAQKLILRKKNELKMVNEDVEKAF